MTEIKIEKEIDQTDNDQDEKKDNEEIFIESKHKIGSKLIGKINDFFANPKKRLIFIIIIGLLTITLFGIGLYFLTHEKPEIKKEETVAAKEENEKKVTLYEAPLDGLMVSKEASDRHPLAIIVENHTDARPQSGLDKASVVYEALAEGGITRFMAIFGTNEAEKVGPVRSARTYFVDWAHGFTAFFAHVGGNMDALEKIASEKMYDLDEMRYGEPTFWREKSSNLAIEHTMYTSTVKLRELASDLKYSSSNNFTIYKFKDDPSGEGKTALPEKQRITVNFSNPNYNTYFQYDKETNSYKRFLAGAAHNDRVSKNQLNPKNLVVMSVANKPTLTKINEQGLEMTTVGSGKAKIFLDGKVIDGTWKKDGKADREIFYDENNNEVVFNRGQLWICVTPPDVTPIVE